MTDFDALKKRAIEKGLRVDEDATPPTQEELEAYIKEVEKSYLTEEEQELALQAQADLAKGEALAREAAKKAIKDQKRMFKGIYTRTHFNIWAKQPLRREQLRQEAELGRARQEQESQ